MSTLRHSFLSAYARWVMGISVSLTLGMVCVAPYAVAQVNGPEAALTPSPPVPGTPFVEVYSPYQEIRNKIGSFFQTLTLGGVTAILNASQQFTQKIAYDAAQRILTGDQGQYPLFWEDGYGPYLKKVGDSARDQFIDSLNTEVFKDAGFDLCAPSDLLKLKLSLGGPLGKIPELKAKCTKQKVGEAFDKLGYDFQHLDDIQKNVTAQYDPQSSPLSVGLQLHSKILGKQISEQATAAQNRQETGGFKFVQEALSGKIKTPAQLVKDTLQASNSFSLFRDEQGKITTSILTNAFSIGARQLAILTASTFANTLASGALDKLLKCFSTCGVGDDPSLGNVDLVNSQSVVNNNVASARIVFSDFLTPNLISNDQQDFVTELSTCPTPRGLWGCAMDDAFAAALRGSGETGAYTVGRASNVVLNGLPSGNPAFLHADWQLIPLVDAKEDQDPTCYQRAYCSSNLMKLRYSRIIPIGWELAANSPSNKKKNGQYVTLGEVIQGFNQCNAKGQIDAQHPWCKLIDPNWVLTAPPFQCRVKGYGDTVFPGTSLRLQECADAVSCLGRDDHGKCVSGYGYCLAEKSVWRFSADACSEKFASCRTYVGANGQQVSFLRNTLDYGSCSADNAGCLWYATTRDSLVTSTDAWIGTATSGPRVYFDGTIKPCSASDEGCTRLAAVEIGQPSLNLIRNGSFEQAVPDNATKLAGWKLAVDYKNPQVALGATAVDGGRSLEPLPNAGQEAFSDRIAVVPLRYYSLSIYGRSKDPAVLGQLGLKLLLTKKDNSAVTGQYFRSEGCEIKAPNVVGFNHTFGVANASTIWKRLECTFVSNSESAFAGIIIQGQNVLVDGVQVEEGEGVTPYIDGLNINLQETHMKVPPEDLACKGEAADTPACDKFARVCQQTEQGCQGYRDVNNPTAPEIPASLSAADACPMSCVGYAEYRKQSSAFDLGKSVDDRLNDPQDDTSAFFIPSRADSCSAVDLGCEEFTNVEGVATGGEQKSYYNYVRSCEKPGNDSETFFTWEGSDTTGYQLKTWSLIHDSSVNVPGKLDTHPPKLIEKMGPDAVLKEPAGCSAASWQAGIDADCRQFFNANGDVFYSYFSQTILSSPECRDLRKSSSDVADCVKTGGSFTPATGECIYKVLPTQSISCNRQNAGCRAYIGTTGRNTAIVFEEDFKSGTGTHPFSAGSLSNESILVGDKSLKITGAQPLSTDTFFPSSFGTLYTVSFWAKAIVPSQVSSVLVDDRVIGTFTLGADWQRYEIGPFTASSTFATSTLSWTALANPTFLDQIRVERLQDVTYSIKGSWTIPLECDQTIEGAVQPQAMLGCRQYQDRNNKVYTLRQFGQLCREKAIGCSAFIDTRNSVDSYQQDFALPGTDINTKQNGLPHDYEESFVGTVTTTRLSDRFIYLIDEPRSHCSAENASCRAFGKPRYAQDQFGLDGASSSSAFQTVYFVDDITSYVDASGEPKTLCRKNELFCAEFKSGKTVAYFRNPSNHTCDWKDAVQLTKNPALGIPANGSYSGWFRTGTNEPCYHGLLSSGSTFLKQNSGDVSYLGWVAQCPVEQSECTEFRDPNDHSDPFHAAGKPYFFIRNSRLDLSSCNGKVDLLSGCVLFRDLTDARLKYSTVATYAKSAAEGNSPQTPVDCVADPNNPYCLKKGTCTDLQKECASQTSCDESNAFIKSHLNAVCSTNADCSISSGDAGADPDFYSVTGSCAFSPPNDANAVMKVKLDRDCAEWLGCSGSETVYDPAQQKYVDLCTNVAMCDVSKGNDAGSFCAHYVDRSKEPVLKPGVFLDQATYASRSVGFGKTDYSGYSLANHFQVADLQNRQVGSELFSQSPDLAGKFALEYRLVAAVPSSTGLVQFFTQAQPLDNQHPKLDLCVHRQTGRVGYALTPPGGERTCYFSPDSLSVLSEDLKNQGQQNGQLSSDPRNMQVLSDILTQAVDRQNNKTLLNALPPPECMANPESDSPFSNTYVTEWKTDQEPIKPTKIVAGYEAGNLCDYGEDCACGYRKVKFGQQLSTHYIAPLGTLRYGGLCSGGSKSGESCVPGQTITAAADGSTSAAVSTNEDPGCPGGGRCIEVSDVTLVRGQFGQCLQRDYSRIIANDPGRYPCLIWNPNPILVGTKDQYHYQPSAGYLPPVNAGEFYCMSYANPPKTSVWTALSHTDWKDSKKQTSAANNNPLFLLPGKLSKFNYDRGYIAGRCPETSDRCGSFNEGACNCHDGITSGDALNSDWEETMSVAADSGALETNTALSLMDETSKTFFQAILSAVPLVGKTVNDVLGKIPVVQGVFPADTKQSLLKDARQDPLKFASIWRGQALGQGIDGAQPGDDAGDVGDQAKWCAEATGSIPKDAKPSDGSDGYPGHGGQVPGIGPFDRAPDTDPDLGRWIQTGRGLGRTYMEYFVPVKPAGVLSWLYGTTANKPSDQAALEAAVAEKNFAQFNFFAKNDKFLSACRIPKWYVDGVDITDFKDSDKVTQASNQIFSAFTKEFDGTLDRSKEHLLVNKAGQPQKINCSGLNDGKDPTTLSYASQDGKCYYKYWETDYRMDGVSDFNWVNEEGTDSSFWERHTGYYSHEATCNKSGFAIRAMFENTDKNQNALDQKDGNPETLTGPYRFVGFWITACTKGTEKESFLYLGLSVKHADVCRELAQVVSPFSRQSAAFADRTWSKGTFTVPVLGLSYISGYAPFGSALVNGIPGTAPLFQTNGPAENYSPLKPPTFLGSGQSYAALRPTPIYNWAYLTNIFARVYRVYHFYDTAVTKNSTVCSGTINFGALCTADTAQKVCGGQGSCNTATIPVQTKNKTFRCNGLSGVNAGLTCGDSFSLPSLDPSCHNAAMKKVGDGAYQPQLSKCSLRIDPNANVNWTFNSGNGLYINPADGKGYSEKIAHERFNAFGCAAGSVDEGAPCEKPEDHSWDCPTLVDKIPCIADDFGIMNGHCGGGYEQARCSANLSQKNDPNPPPSTDCVFTKSQWWGARDKGKPEKDVYNNNFMQLQAWYGPHQANNNATDANPALYKKELPFEYFGKSPGNDNTVVVGLLNKIDDIGRSYKHGGLRYPGNAPLSYGNMLNPIALGFNTVLSDYTPSGQPSVNQTTPADTMILPFAYYLQLGSAAVVDKGADLLKRWPTPHNVLSPAYWIGGNTNSSITDDKQTAGVINFLQNTVVKNNQAYVIPGLCEGANGADMDPAKSIINTDEFPNFAKNYSFYAAPNYASEVGVCDGGVNDGQLCYASSAASPSGINGSLWPNYNFCSPKSVQNKPWACQEVTAINGCISPALVATNPDDPDLDDNRCTHGAGYKPRLDLCAGNLSSEKCLVGYDINSPASLDDTKSLAPTDVTAGFHTPDFLQGKNNSADYSYIAHYAPRPPTVAAPDLGHACQTPGSCPISSVNSFLLENQSSGAVSFGGGQAQVSMRFYGWAAHEQTPLKSVFVDWGDGNVVKIEDARVKNKKPFCGATRECQLVPGLTCNTDGDCPPAGGACVERGTCSQAPSLSCTSDAQCAQASGVKDDKCQIRELFGNSTDACEANYFEFQHAYSCDKLMRACDTDAIKDAVKRCSRNTNVTCSKDADCCTGGGCGVEDKCIAGLAQPGGCFDNKKQACVFTPRIMLKDSWNWCTGECRKGVQVGNGPIDTANSKVKHVYGGCWDGTETFINDKLSDVKPATVMTSITSECNESSFATGTRPWITYPGAVEIGTSL